ncbi:hypothetical protein [Acholeplasma granularum]|uniref:hypothetical protein n=1 Tax=Acholeplasma granularum TaxID=264635 RepID=UPI00046EA06E|nr:hypothetical protein [Acholeplasma granularum]
MKINNEFRNDLDLYLAKLGMYVPIVARVHGKHHPQIYKVKDIFEVIVSKTDKGISDINLDEEFNQLKEITHNYLVPNDVCESYEAVYNMLQTLNNSYDKR